MANGKTFADEVVKALEEARGPDAGAVAAAAARNGVLTKPPGALGSLEDLAVWYGGWRGTDRPQVLAPQVIIFAGNHGVVAQGISAFPAEVTVQMVANFEAGGAAINQLAKMHGAKMDVVALELDRPTADFTQAPAMNADELDAALKAGWDAVDAGSDLLVVGEMGIGNTTAAAAIAYALFGGDAAMWAGRGTGLDDAGVARKAEVIDRAVALHKGAMTSPMAVLAHVGGREIAAMAGAIARARTLGIPVILDGYICCAAASILAQSVAGALDHAVAGHKSEEAGHIKLLEALDKKPLLDLGLRLGEGSGAALAIGVLKGAVACHSGMATFAEAGVSDG